MIAMGFWHAGSSPNRILGPTTSPSSWNDEREDPSLLDDELAPTARDHHHALIGNARRNERVDRCHLGPGVWKSVR